VGHEILSASAAIFTHQESVNQLNRVAVVQDSAVDHQVQLIHRDRHERRSRAASQFVKQSGDHE